MRLVQVSVPDLGELIETVRIVNWLRQPGERVGAEDALVEIASDKIDAVISSPAAGLLTTIAVATGERVPVGTVLGYIEAE